MEAKKERLKEDIRILRSKGIKIKPLRAITEGKNKKSDFGNNLKGFWEDVNSRIEYSEEYLLRLIDNNNIIGFAIPTGYYNNIVVIDVDNKESSNKQISNELIEKLKEQNTLTIKTAGGGFHFIFRYADLLKKGTTGILGHIDIRTNRNLIFSGIREDGEYTILNNSNIKKLDDNIIKIIIDNIDIHKGTTKKHKQTTKKGTNTNIRCYTSDKRRYDITDEEIKELLEGLPKQYLDEYKEWLKITATLKTIDKKQVWDDWSKNGKNYNKKNNNKIWDDLGEIEGYNNNLTYLFWLFKFHNPNKKLKTIEQIFNDFIELNKDHLAEAININEKYLNTSLLDDFQKLTIIKSSTNTGKTTLTINYMKTQTTKKILSITHLKTIADDHFKRFNEEGIKIFHYEDHKGIISDDWINESEYIGGVIVINSILRLDIDDLKNYIIYLDEITAIIETILNSPTIKERKEIINKFFEILNSCYAIIATDATITDITKEILEGATETKAKFIINHYKNYQDKKAYFIDDYNEILELLKKDLINKGLPIICSNSKRRLEQLRVEIVKLKKEHNITFEIKVYTSTEGDKIKDVNEEWLECVPMFSPSIVQGVDFKPEDKRNVYSFVVGNTTIDPIQVSQQIARNRNPLNTYINIEDAKNKSIYKGDIRKVRDFYKGVGETYKNIFNKMIKYYNNDCDIKTEHNILNGLIDTKTTYKGVEKIDNPITEQYYNYKNNQDILRSSFKYHLKEILKNKGYEVIDRLFYNEETRTKKEIIEEKKKNKEYTKEIYEEIKNNQFEEWINNKMKETEKYKQATDKKIEILNLNKIRDEATIRDYKDILINDGLFKMMVNICFRLCISNMSMNKKTANNIKNDFIENIYNDISNHIISYKSLLIKYFPEINPYFYTYNEEDYINQPIEITDDEYKNIKLLTKTTKQKPNNKIDLLRLLNRIAKIIFNGIISLKKNKSRRINKSVKQYQRVIFHYPLFHKYLKYIKGHYNSCNICPFIRAYIETEDFNNNDNENIDYDFYIKDDDTKDNEDNKSIMSNEGTETSEAETEDNDIYKGTKNPYKNIDIEILRDDILYLDFA